MLGSLADVNFKTFHYAAASRFYDQLFACCSSVLEPALLKDDQDDNATLKLLLDTPPQTIDIPAPVDIPTHADAIGSFAADLTVNGVTNPWVLDTGANLSCISESFAKRLGLQLSTGSAETMGATGAENALHVAILPELHVGTATVHDVVLLVLPDANLTLPLGKKKSYTIPAILGYPVFQSLGVIRFAHDHHFLAGPTLETGPGAAPIYFDKLSPLLVVLAHGKPRPFLFDSGANVTFPTTTTFPSTFSIRSNPKARLPEPVASSPVPSSHSRRSPSNSATARSPCITSELTATSSEPSPTVTKARSDATFSITSRVSPSTSSTIAPRSASLSRTRSNADLPFLHAPPTLIPTTCATHSEFLPRPPSTSL